MNPQKQADHIIIFDGVCNLCNTSINFIMRHDREQRFSFAANQQGAGKEILDAFGVASEDVGTIYYVENGKLYNRSTAVLRLSRYLRFPFNLGYGFLIVPRFIRDSIYKWIAKNRYRWFGKKDTCRIPTAEEAARFI